MDDEEEQLRNASAHRYVSNVGTTPSGPSQLVQAPLRAGAPMFFPPAFGNTRIQRDGLVTSPLSNVAGNIHIPSGLSQVLQTPLRARAPRFISPAFGNNAIQRDGMATHTSPLPSLYPYLRGPQGTSACSTSSSGTNHDNFMRDFQAGGMTSFPSNSIEVNCGNLPSQAFVPRLSTDMIQSRSFGHELGDNSNKRARAMYARPPPSAPTGRNQKVPTCKREIFLPCKMTKPCLYKTRKINITMKKVTQFYSLPVTIVLPKDTKWGGVYDGGNFLQGSAQLHIAEQCSLVDPKNSAWASIPGCFFSKTSNAQLTGIGPKYMGGAAVTPLYYPPHAQWSDLPRKPIVYIPNPLLQMTAQQVQMYKEISCMHENPIGMDALEDGEGVGDVEVAESRNSADTNSLNDNNSLLSDDMDDSTPLGNNYISTRRSDDAYTDEDIKTTRNGGEDEQVVEPLVDMAESIYPGKGSQEYNLDTISTSSQTARMHSHFHRGDSNNIQLLDTEFPHVHTYQRKRRSHQNAISFSSTLEDPDVDMTNEPTQDTPSAMLHVLEGDIVVTNQSPYDASTSTPILNISSDDEYEDPPPRGPRRCTQRSSNMLRGTEITQYRGGRRGLRRNIQEESSTRITRRYEELLSLWLAASEECGQLIAKYSEGSITTSNYTHGEGSTIIVDLGDLSRYFWECFDAACLEDSDSAREVQVDLELLSTRRSQRMGMTKEMVDVKVPRILNHVKSLEAYNKHNVETFFNKAAMINWQRWGDLTAVLDLDILDMKSVEENEDYLLQLFRKASNTLSKKNFTEDSVITLRAQYLDWKAKDDKFLKDRLSRSEDEYKIITARKREAHALHQLTVYHISHTSLTDFREFHERAPRIYLEVNQGGELIVIRNMCQEVITNNTVFGDFSVTYTTVTSNYSLRENNTIDAGGLTDRLLTQAWSALFNSSGEFHSVFEKGDTINHLSSVDPDPSPQRQNDIILVGQLMFLIALKEQRVTRETTMATLAMAMGQVPDKVSIKDALEKNQQNMYVDDYKQFRPNEFSLMSQLLGGGIDNASETIGLITSSMTDDCLRFGKLTIDFGEDQFQVDVRNVMTDIIYNTLFVRCLGVAKYLRQGFISMINTVVTSTSIPESDKKDIVLKSFNGVEVSAMGAFFSAEQVVTAEEFLSRVDYEHGFPPDLKAIFIEAVSGFTCPEACRLYAFITDEKFNRGTRCNVKCNRKSSVDALPQAATCTKTLELSRYTNVNTMIQKLSLATYSMDYGYA